MQDYTGNASELVIPASVTWNDESYDVVSVLRGIQNNTNLTSVDIQAPITSLNNSLFMGCTSLTHVGLPATLREIETAAFSGCTS